MKDVHKKAKALRRMSAEERAAASKAATDEILEAVSKHTAAIRECVVLLACVRP